jgi:hypothetical protein
MTDGPRRKNPSELALDAPWRKASLRLVEQNADRSRLLLEEQVEHLLDRPTADLIARATNTAAREREVVIDTLAVGQGAFRQHRRLTGVASISLHLHIEPNAEIDETIEHAEVYAHGWAWYYARAAIEEALRAAGRFSGPSSVDEFTRARLEATRKQLLHLVPFAVGAIKIGMSLKASATDSLSAGSMTRQLRKMTARQIAKVLTSVTRDMKDEARGAGCYLTHEELVEIFDEAWVPEHLRDDAWAKNRNELVVSSAKDTWKCISNCPGLRT